MNEDKSTRYHRRRRRAQVASLATAGALLAVATAAGIGASLPVIATRLADRLWTGDQAPWWLVTACAAILVTVALEAVSLPWAFHLGFVLESQYGLSRQSAADWCRDHLKASALTLGVAAGLALVVYGAMRVAGPWWWLAAGLGFSILGAGLAVIGPVVLFPLFYRVTRLPPGDLPDRLTALADRAGAPVIGVYEWSLGDKTRAANAALVGLGPSRRVLVSDTLLQQAPPDEIEVILAHELGHHVHGDVWKGGLLDAVRASSALAVAHLALDSFGPALSLEGRTDLAGLPLMVFAAGVWLVLTGPVVLAQSRRHERRADRFALDLTRKADAFISAMRRLGEKNLANDAPPRLVEWLFHSHPSMGQRIDAARRWAREL